MSETILSIQHLSKSYTANTQVLHDVSLDVVSEGILIVIGPSGAGKSTLMRCINHLVTPTSGKIIFRGVEVSSLHGKAMREVRRRIGMVFQEFNLVERLTVLENMLIGRLGYMSTWDALRRKYSDDDIGKAEAMLERLGLAEFALKRADNLSGGQRQRVGIGRALMQNPELLLADEPTSSLDPKTSVEVMQTMAELARERRIPVIVNMHDVNLARRFADRIVGMANGRIVFDGSTEQLTKDTLAKIYGGDSWMH